MVLLARRKLKPLTFLITNVIKSTIWVVLFILEIVSLTTSRQSHTASALAIIIEAALLCVLLANLKLRMLTLAADYVSGSLLSMAESSTTVSERTQNPTSLSITQSRIFLTNTPCSTPNIRSPHNISPMRNPREAKRRTRYRGGH